MAKTYIGSGKQHDKYDIISVSICMDDAEKFIFEYNGKKYLKFDVAKKREADQYGKTHSVSVWTPDDGNRADSEQVTNDEIPY